MSLSLNRSNFSLYNHTSAPKVIFEEKSEAKVISKMTTALTLCRRSSDIAIALLRNSTLNQIKGEEIGKYRKFLKDLRPESIEAFDLNADQQVSAIIEQLKRDSRARARAEVTADICRIKAAVRDEFCKIFGVEVCSIESELSPQMIAEVNAIRCAEYAFIKLNSTNYGRILERSLFELTLNEKFEKLISEYKFTPVGKPQKNDLIVYLNKDYQAVHFGIFENSQQIKSKWGENEEIFLTLPDQVPYGKSNKDDKGESYLLLRQPPQSLKSPLRAL